MLSCSPFSSLLAALCRLSKLPPMLPASVVEAAAPVVETLDPTPAQPPPPKARTVEQFDTTTAEDRAAAVAKPEPAGETKLGTTIATLGSPADPGIWIKTPLVTELVMGRAVYGANGRSVNLELAPVGWGRWVW